MNDLVIAMSVQNALAAPSSPTDAAGSARPQDQLITAGTIRSEGAHRWQTTALGQVRDHDERSCRLGCIDSNGGSVRSGGQAQRTRGCTPCQGRSASRSPSVVQISEFD
ncbi:MAG: hypothetical protein QOF35_1855 [Actinomycetota bacterium]|jgi:hypothetical protein|nr:hypothetical protein [Actinomycetota bacterium]